MQLLLDPQLLFAQTCGYPLMHSLSGKVQLIATPCYDLPGCRGNLHCSWLVVRENDSRQAFCSTTSAGRMNQVTQHSLDLTSGRS